MFKNVCRNSPFSVPNSKVWFVCQTTRKKITVGESEITEARKYTLVLMFLALPIPGVLRDTSPALKKR